MSVEFEREVITTVTAEITLDGVHVGTEFISEISEPSEVVTTIDVGIADEAIVGEQNKISNERMLKTVAAGHTVLTGILAGVLVGPVTERFMNKPNVGNAVVAAAGVVAICGSIGFDAFTWARSSRKIQKSRKMIEVLEQAKVTDEVVKVV